MPGSFAERAGAHASVNGLTANESFQSWRVWQLNGDTTRVSGAFRLKR
jgi:hypothetical protein